MEQYWRDNRLNMIHEGTHGIQALDLLVRKKLISDQEAEEVEVGPGPVLRSQDQSPDADDRRHSRDVRRGGSGAARHHEVERQRNCHDERCLLGEHR